MEYKMILTDEQKAILNGEKGETLAKVMETVIRYGELFGAEKLVPVTSKYNHLVTSFGLKALGPVYDLMDKLIEEGVVTLKEAICCRDDIMVYLMYHGVKPIKAFKIMEFVRKGKASKDAAGWAEHRATMEEAGIEEWFIDSCFKIKYMFPKAHAAAYVTSAFRIAWYKVHMPEYFYASWYSTKATDFDIDAMIKGYDAIKNRILEIKAKGYDATNKENGVLECLNVALEMAARKIKIQNFDLYKSKGMIFTVEDDNTIIPPFRSIDGLGDVVAKNIETEAQKAPFISIEDFQTRCKVSQTLIDKMRVMGVFKDMPETSQLTLF